MNTLKITSILIGVLVLFSTGNDAALKINQRRLSPTFTLTFVHGDSDAMKSHMDALKFCRGLGKPLATAEIAYNVSETTNAGTTASPAATTVMSTSAPKVTAKSTETIRKTAEKHTIVHADGTRYRSDLVSVHDGHMVNELMRWILNLEKRQFWIGGVVKLIEHQFRAGHPVRHLLQLWTDRTPANFRFLHFDNPMMESMRPNELACVSVDYASGKWGLHSCDTPMYFACETVELGKSDDSISDSLDKEHDDEDDDEAENKKTTVAATTNTSQQTAQTTLASGATVKETASTNSPTVSTDAKTTVTASTSTTVAPTTTAESTTTSA